MGWLWRRTQDQRPSLMKWQSFAHCSSLCIRSCYHKLVRLTRSIILKLCGVCVKQYEKNGQNCGKTIHGFCITIMHLFTHRCLWVIFCPETITPSFLIYHIHRHWLSANYSWPQNWRDPWKTEICTYWGDKDCITGRALACTKKCSSEVLRGLEKALTQVYNIKIVFDIYIYRYIYVVWGIPGIYRFIFCFTTFRPHLSWHFQVF